MQDNKAATPADPQFSEEQGRAFYHVIHQRRTVKTVVVQESELEALGRYQGMSTILISFATGLVFFVASLANQIWLLTPSMEAPRKEASENQIVLFGFLAFVLYTLGGYQVYCRKSLLNRINEESAKSGEP